MIVKLKRLLIKVVLLLKASNTFRQQYGSLNFFSRVVSLAEATMRSRSCEDFKRVTSSLIARNTDATSYADWLIVHENLDNEILNFQRIESKLFEYKTKFSIVVPTYNTPKNLLIEFIESVLSQSYQEWELCIADDHSSQSYVKDLLNQYSQKDPRIKVKFRDINGHIAEATNTALTLVTGDFVCFMDHDDLIAPNALYEFASKLNENPLLDFIYSDEDKISYDGKLRYEPHFKPDWSPEYLECCMYTAHFACYRTELVVKTGGFRKECNGAQDYDFVLRFSEYAKNVAHVPKILYHWRAIPGSTAASMDNKDYVIDAALLVLREHVERTGNLDFVEASKFKGCFHVRRQVINTPKVSIVIPSAGKNTHLRGEDIDLLVNCITSIMQLSTYKNIEIIVVDNNDLRPDTLQSLSHFPIKFVHYKESIFNIAEKMNLGATHSTGDFLLFLNDDIEVVSPDWLEAMLSVAQQPNVGVVGAKLHFEDGTLQHAGVTFCNGLPDHIRRGYPGDEHGYYFSSEGQRNYLAVTGACMLIGKDLFNQIDGFDERFAINYNDIDLCLKAWKLGLRIVYTGQAQLFHFESRNRKREVAKHEEDLFLSIWRDATIVDPYYSHYFRANPPNFILA
ncbi:glycosyltransferase [Methylotenera sp.]|uniref:glycosyltransferase family 2 protein n=1 Tax=Methylotenera sp. TaxID=2051956 RepID=UPI002489CCAB|nr:glycosyltransferase [Methylotenera sp.]MDI1299681.1 glycosyltransferase [Methylotenera sp.]